MQIALNLNDPSVQAALIGAVGNLLTGVLAAICAAIIGKQIAGRRKLQAKLFAAQADIEFLLAVEQCHGAIHAESGGQSLKNTVRRTVRESGLNWSGNFTPGRLGTRPQAMLESQPG